MFANQKAQQISLALIKMSVQVRRVDFRSRLERIAFQLLEDVAGDRLEPALRDLDIIKSFVELGKAIYQIEPINAKILLQESDILISAIRQTIGIDLGNGEQVNIESIFSKPPAIPQAENTNNDHRNNLLEPFATDSTGAPKTNSIDSNNNGNGINGTIRQSAILDKIRQSGKAGLRDILILFPEISERTIRYDLQKLCNQGVLDRIGNGGPATYYAPRM